MSLADLRTHARVASTEHELRIWLPARWPFLAVSALVLAASLTTEAVLVAYARQQNSSGAWAIVTIVTLWLLAVVLMIRRRLRAIVADGEVGTLSVGIVATASGWLRHRMLLTSRRKGTKTRRPVAAASPKMWNM